MSIKIKMMPDDNESENLQRAVFLKIPLGDIPHQFVNFNPGKFLFHLDTEGAPIPLSITMPYPEHVVVDPSRAHSRLKNGQLQSVLPIVGNVEQLKALQKIQQKPKQQDTETAVSLTPSVVDSVYFTSHGSPSRPKTPFEISSKQQEQNQESYYQTMSPLKKFHQSQEFFSSNNTSFSLQLNSHSTSPSPTPTPQLDNNSFHTPLIHPRNSIQQLFAQSGQGNDDPHEIFSSHNRIDGKKHDLSPQQDNQNLQTPQNIFNSLNQSNSSNPINQSNSSNPLNQSNLSNPLVHLNSSQQSLLHSSPSPSSAFISSQILHSAGITPQLQSAMKKRSSLGLISSPLNSQNIPQSNSPSLSLYTPSPPRNNPINNNTTHSTDSKHPRVSFSKEADIAVRKSVSFIQLRVEQTQGSTPSIQQYDRKKIPVLFTYREAMEAPLSEPSVLDNDTLL